VYTEVLGTQFVILGSEDRRYFHGTLSYILGQTLPITSAQMVSPNSIQHTRRIQQRLLKIL
jgi:hypothetical protein